MVNKATIIYNGIFDLLDDSFCDELPEIEIKYVEKNEISCGELIILHNKSLGDSFILYNENLEDLFLPYEFNTDNHKLVLEKIETYVFKLKNKVTTIIINNEITDKNHTEYFDKTVRVLRYVGELSMVAFNVEKELCDLYTLAFIHDPMLGTSVFQKHYNMLHKPYNFLKNRCFKILDSLDAAYEAKFDKQPPNFKSKKSIFF